MEGPAGREPPRRTAARRAARASRPPYPADMVARARGRGQRVDERPARRAAGELRVVDAPPELALRAPEVRHHARLDVEVQAAVGLVLEPGPLGRAALVRVAAAGEPRPVGADDLAEPIVLRGGQRDGPEHVGHLGAVERVQPERLEERNRELAREVVQVRARPAGRRPARRVVGAAHQAGVAEDPLQRVLRGGEARRRVERGHLAGPRSVARLELGQVLRLGGDRGRADEEDRPLVAVGPEQVGHPREAAGVEQRAGLVGQEAAVHERPEGKGPQVGQQRRRRHLAEAGQLVRCARAADRRGERGGGGGALGGGALARRAAAALADRAMEELAAAGRRHLVAHVRRPGGLAEDRDLARVAAERGDVGLDPAQGRLLVEQPLVAREGMARVLASERGVTEEPEHVQPVVDRDHHDVALLGQHVAVVDAAPRDARERHDVGGGSGHVRAAVEPHHHRPRLRWRRVGRPDVQVEAILGLARGPLDRRELRAGRRPRVGLEDVLPGDDGCGRPPAQRADRRRDVRDAQELARAAVHVPLHVAVREVQQRALLDPRLGEAGGGEEGDDGAGERRDGGRRSTGSRHGASLLSRGGHRKRGAISFANSSSERSTAACGTRSTCISEMKWSRPAFL